jgi:exodeoxyribonuclease VIII
MGGNMNIEPGIYDDLTFSEYRRINAIGKSDLMAWALGDKPELNADIANEGTAFHTAMLEPQLWKEHISVAPDTMERRSKAGKEAWAAFCDQARSEGRTPIMARQKDIIAEMSASVVAHPQLNKLRRMKSKREVTVVWDCQGVRLKARIDQANDKAIWDWKSTSQPDADGFAESCLRYFYHVQQAMYQDGWHANTGQMLPFIFVPVCKRPPYSCWPHRIEQVHIDHARTLYQTLVGLYARKDDL